MAPREGRERSTMERAGRRADSFLAFRPVVRILQRGDVLLITPGGRERRPSNAVRLPACGIQGIGWFLGMGRTATRAAAEGLDRTEDSCCH
jgi:hypothetical protein